MNQFNFKRMFMAFLTLMVYLNPTLIKAQTFSVQADTISATVDGIGGPSNNITNITGVDIPLKWYIKATDFPLSWLTGVAFGICDNYTCYANGSGEVYNTTTNTGVLMSSTYYANSTHDSLGVFGLSLNFNAVASGTHWLKVNLLDNNSSYSKDVVFIITRSHTVGISGASVGTQQISLSPNPAQQATSLALALSRAGDIRVNIMDMQGRIVKSLSKEGVAGTQKIEIATNGLAAGLYLVQVQADGQTSKEKLSVIK